MRLPWAAYIVLHGDFYAPCFDVLEKRRSLPQYGPYVGGG